MEAPDRQAVLQLLRRLSESFLGERLILAGSSGVYGASETLPALTEDVDVLVDADWAAAQEGVVLAEMERLGFRHEEATPTFLTPEGAALDFVGYSREDTVDRIGGGDRLRIMVFADLSRLLADPGATVELRSGGRALSAPCLSAVKLLTIRLEKGSKDKLQALLLIEENADDPVFLASLGRALGRFEPDRISDALADAQAASLSLGSDAARADLQAAGYLEFAKAVDRGLDVLRKVVSSLEPAR